MRELYFPRPESFPETRTDVELPDELAARPAKDVAVNLTAYYADLSDMIVTLGANPQYPSAQRRARVEPGAKAPCAGAR
jgi:hypothetical protein